MDWGGWINFFTQGVVLGFLCSFVGGAVVGAAIVSYGRMPLWLGIVVGGLLPVLGHLVLLVIALVRAAASRRTPDSRASSTPAVTASPWSTAPTVSLWEAAAVEQAAGPHGTVSPFGTEMPPAYTGPSAPPSTASSRLRRVDWRFTTVRGIVALVALAALTVAAVSALFVHWFTFDSQVVAPLDVWSWGTGIDTAVLVSVALLLVAGVLATVGPSRWASAIAAIVGGFWTFVGGLALAASAPLTSLLEDIDDFSYSVGDVVTGLGMDPSAGSIELPDGVDLSALGIAGSTVDLSGVDLAAPIPAATLELGPAWFIVTIVGVGILAWAIAEIAQAGRSRKATRRT